HRDVVPHARPGEPDDGVDAHLPRDARREPELLGRALAHPLGLAVAPHARADDRFVAEVDRVVAHGLAREVVRDRPHLEPAAVEQLAPLAHVRVVLRGTPHVEVLARARDLEAVVTPLGREPGDLLERKVDPLAGEQGDGQPPRAGHDASWSRSRNWMERSASSSWLAASGRQIEAAVAIVSLSPVKLSSTSGPA